MTRIVIMLALVAAVAGCKKKSASNFGKQLATMNEFADSMCQCKDKACAHAVHERMKKWSTEMVEKAGTSRDERPDEASMKRMTEIGEKYAECMTKAMQPAPEVAPLPSAPPPTIKLSTPADRPRIATLIQEAKEYTRAAEDELVLHIVTALYVAATGELDPKHGELTIGFGNRLTPTDPGDDPNRPTGAPEPEPVTPPPTKRADSELCPRATWRSTTGWTWSERSCQAAFELTPRCSTAEVWTRALKTPGLSATNAVAILDLVRNPDASQAWEFSIQDARRKVDVRVRIPDDCEPIAEQP